VVGARAQSGFHSYAELFGGGQAVDRVRGQNVPKVGPTLDYLGAPVLASSLYASSHSYSSFFHR